MSIRLIFIAFLLLLTQMATRAQVTTFDYLFSTNDNEILIDIVEDKGGNLFAAISTSPPDRKYKKDVLYLMISDYGILEDSIRWAHPLYSLSIYELLWDNSTEEFISASIFHDTTVLRLNGGLIVSRMTKELIFYDSVTYYFPWNFAPIDLTSNLNIDNGNLLLAGGYSLDKKLPKTYIYELNEDLDSVKAKFHTENQDMGVIWDIRAISGSSYWALKALTYEYYLLDSEFNKVSEFEIPENTGGNISLKWDTDTSFYMLGDKIYPDPSHNLKFFKQFHPFSTDDLITNEWGISDTIDFPAAWQGIDFITNDSIFIGGTRGFGYYNHYHHTEPSWFIILQTDSLLNVRWERFYGGDAYYMLTNILATKDGGVVIAGTRYDYENSTEQQTDILFLKLNDDGIIVNDNEIPSIKMHEAIVYPNPGTTEIKVRIAAQYKESTFQLFDMNGKQVASENIIGKWGTINTSFLKPGTYIYRISSEDGLFESGKWVKQ